MNDIERNDLLTNGGLFVPLAEVEALQRAFNIERNRLLERNKKLQEDCERYHEWGFCEGYEKAKQQIPKWHFVADGDLPTNEDNRFYMCISENHEEDLPTMFQYDSELGFGWWEDIYDEHTLGFVDSEFHTVEEEHLEKVIAWMELPKFESEE